MISNPVITKTSSELLVGENILRFLNLSVHLNDMISSEVQNTAGITVEKLTVASKKYSKLLKYSRPSYSQFWVLRLINSNNHQDGAKAMNNKINLFLLLSISDVPVR